MAIPAEDIAMVRAATDIAALIGERTALKRVGRRFVGLCPFHGEKTASFSVNAEEGLYYCFGCQASGDAIRFVERIEGCDFVEAVERLAARAGLQIRNDADAAGDATRGRRPVLYDALRRAADFYHEHLLSAPDAGPARQYLRSRGYDGETVRRFGLGFAPPGWDELARALKLPTAIGKEAGLVFENSRGRLQDSFRERVIFPIFDPGDRVVALGGRVLPDELRRLTGAPGPKYRNSPESPIYQKRATLYGLNWAKAEMTHADEAIVCEGYTDVIGLFRAGLPRAVATCGTALTEDHFRLLARFAHRIVLCFDADRAGENAAARLYEWERRHELELAVASLPPGSDPAELAHVAPEALVEAVSSARPFLGFLLERVLQSAAHSPESRARTATAAIAVIAEHPNPLVRDEYLLEVADRTHLDLERLRGLLEEAVRKPGERRGPPAAVRTEASDEPPPRDPDGEEWPPRRPAAGRAESRAGRDALVLAVHRPADLAGRLHEALFVEPLQRRAYVALSEATELHEAIDGADPEVADLLARLAVAADPEAIDLDYTMVELVRVASAAALHSLERRARLSNQRGDSAGLEAINIDIHFVKEQLEMLRDPILHEGVDSPARGATECLIAWLASWERNVDDPE